MRLSEAAARLRAGGISDSRTEARLLFCHIGKIPPYKTVGEDPECELSALSSALERRINGEPLSYILGSVSFYRESYEVSPDTLIPRSDTEALVEYAIANLSDGDRFIDLCTGSGCIAISTLCNTKGTRAIAIDISEKALEIAEKNAAKNGVSDRISFRHSDVLSDEPDGDMSNIRALLSNPPYVTPAEYAKLDREIYFEPSIAFLGGEDGGDFYRAITKKYKDLLCEDGFIAYEIGYTQSELISKIAEDNEMSVEILEDLGKRPRVAVLKRKQARL